MGPTELEMFLFPQRKENFRFVFPDSEGFVQDGKPVEWVMRELSAAEGLELQRELRGKDPAEIMTAYVARAMVYPDLQDAALLEGLSRREGRTILGEAQALKALLTDRELAALVRGYVRYFQLNEDFAKREQAAKN